MNISDSLSTKTVEQLKQHDEELSSRISELQETITASLTASEEATDVTGILEANKTKKAAKIEIEQLSARQKDVRFMLAALEDNNSDTVESVTGEETVDESQSDETSETKTTDETENETIETTVDETDNNEKIETTGEQETQETSVEAEQETVVDADSQETVAASQGETSVSVKDPSETTGSPESVTASLLPTVDGAKDAYEAITKVAARKNGGEAFKIQYDNGQTPFNMATASLLEATDMIMSLPTPGREDELSDQQTKYLRSKNITEGTDIIAAAFCAPAQKIDADVQCGGYERVIGNLFPSFAMEGLEVEWLEPIDVESEANYVGEVQLYTGSHDSGYSDVSSINKACYELGCLTRTSKRAREIKACLQANEQTVFTNPTGVNAVLRDGEALLAALADEILLEQIVDETLKMSYTSKNAGYGEVTVATTIALEALERQSKIRRVEDMVALVPRSLLNYAISDNAVRQFSLADANQAAQDLFGGVDVRQIALYDDALDASNTNGVPALSKWSATALTPRKDWSIHLINPADAFVAFRNENEWSLEPVAQSIAEKKANRWSWFARSYELFGRRGCGSWATIELDGLCLGGKVIAAATCIK